jgi:hypothetical protein
MSTSLGKSHPMPAYGIKPVLFDPTDKRRIGLWERLIEASGDEAIALADGILEAATKWRVWRVPNRASLIATAQHVRNWRHVS